MNWQDERYVRLYTRDTPDWVAWCWQARALLPLLLRKVDRAGTMPLGKRGIEGVAALVQLPQEVSDAGMNELLNDGCLVVRGNLLVIRNFIEAQEARQSDKSRQAESRARRREIAKPAESQDVDVTGCHTASPGVTSSHQMSQPVTPSLAVPSCAVPSFEEKKPMSAPADCLAVFEHWQRVHNHLRSSLDSKRQKLIKAALAKGYSIDDLKRAIDGCKASPYHQGDNDHKTVYDSIELILRDAGHIDMFIAKATAPQKPKTGPDLNSSLFKRRMYQDPEDAN